MYIWGVGGLILCRFDIKKSIFIPSISSNEWVCYTMMRDVLLSLDQFIVIEKDSTLIIICPHITHCMSAGEVREGGRFWEEGSWEDFAIRQACTPESTIKFLLSIMSANCYLAFMLPQYSPSSVPLTLKSYFWHIGVTFIILVASLALSNWSKCTKRLQ